jgi:hypothetical protein
MKTLDRRLRGLEHQFGIVNNTPRHLVILSAAGSERDYDTYINILDEAGLLQTSGFVFVNFTKIPHELTDEEAEQFVRENAATFCGTRGGP